MAIFSGIAAAIGGAISAVSGFIGGLGAVGAFLLKTAVGVGVSLLAQSLAGKPKDPTFSINGTLQGGGDISRSFILGRTATAGSLVFVNTWGQDGDTPNAYLTQVIALSDLPVRGLAEVWVNGERVTLGGLTDRGYATPGTVFSWTSERNGYIAKLMRIDGVADRANLDVMIDITEVDPADYDWSSDTEFKPPVDGQLGVIRPSPQPIVDWFAEPATVKDSSGEDRRPAIRLTWDNSDGRLDDVIGIEYEVRLQATLEKISEGRTDQPQVGSMLISQSLLPNEDYVVRGRYIPGGDRPVLWSGFIPVTTPNILLSDKDVFVDVDLTGIEEALGWLRNSTRTAQDAIDGLIAAQMEMATVAYKDTRSLARELSVELGAARAEYREDIQLAVNETMAVAGKVETLTAALGGNTASINIAWAAVAAPSGYAARYGITAAVNDENYRSASFLMDVPSNPASPTRIIMKAGQVVMVSDDDATIKRPFVFQSGVLYLDEVRVNQLSALSGVLGNVDISNAYIGTLTVGTSNIDPGAVTRYDATSGNSGDIFSTTFTTVLSFTSFHGAGAPLIEIMFNGAVGAGTAGNAEYRIWAVEDGAALRQRTVLGGGSPSTTSPSTEVMTHTPPSGRTQTTYQFQLRSTAPSNAAGMVGGYMRAFVMKR